MNDMPANELVELLKNMPSDPLNQAAKVITTLQAELAKFHEAMERERKPDWEKWHKDLADRLENPYGPAVDDLRTATRELRYMADSFTLKANFVPAELKIKELETQLSQATERLHNTQRALAEAKIDITDSRKERDESLAQAAVMRGLIDRATNTYHGVLPAALYQELSDCLATSAGKAFLDRMKELEAACAVMRSCLEDIESHEHVHGMLACKCPLRLRDALFIDCGKALLERLRELEAIAASAEEDPTIKYFDEQLGTKGEHSTCETVDNIKRKIDRLQEQVREAEWLLVNMPEYPLGSARFLEIKQEWFRRYNAWLKEGAK